MGHFAYTGVDERGKTVRGTVAPGASARLRFAPGSAALVVNAADREARVDVNLTGDTNLSMGYVAAEAAAEAAAAADTVEAE